MIRHVAISIAIIALAGSSASAQQSVVVPRHRSPTTALVLSLAATALPALSMNAAVTAVGLGLGPAVGLFYAGAPGRGLLGVGLRSAVALGGIVVLFADCDGVEDDVCGIAPVLVSGSLIAASAVWDIVTAPHSAQRWNRAHPMPVIVPVRGGVGVGMRVEF